MQDVTLLEGQAQLPAGHVGVVRRVVVEVRLHVDLCGGRTDGGFHTGQRLPSNSSEFLRGLGTHHVLLDGERFALSAGDEHEGQEAVHVSLEEDEEEETFYTKLPRSSLPSFRRARKPDGRRGRTHQDVEDLVDVLPSDLDAVYLQDLVSFRQQAAPLGRAAPDDATDDHAVHLVADGRPLQEARTRERAKFRDFMKKNRAVPITMPVSGISIDTGG